MHADERLSTLGHASGSAEVAAQALTAVRRALSGHPLTQRHKEALQAQADLIDLLASESDRASNISARAAMLAQDGPSALKNLRTLSIRLSEINGSVSSLVEAGHFLRALAASTTLNSVDRALGETVAVLCKRLLVAALEIVGSATRASVIASESP